MASGKSLTKQENEQLRVVVGDLIQKHGSQRALAEAVPISQQMISHVNNGGAAGVHFATAIAKFCKFRTYAEMLGQSPVPLYGDAPSWKENEPEAMAMNPFPAAAYKLARETPAYVQRDHYSAQTIAATVVWRWAMASEEEKAKATTDAKLQELADERAKRRSKLGPPKDPEPKESPARRAR